MKDYKPLPPFAHNAKIVVGQLWIRAGQQGWRFMKANPQSGECVFPGDKSANEYRWPVTGLVCWIVGGDCPIPRLSGLVVQLLVSGATEVHLIDRRYGTIRNRPMVMHYYADEKVDVSCGA